METTIKVEKLCSINGLNECMGITFDKKTGAIYFAANGKYIYKVDASASLEPVLIADIKEAVDGWNDNFGDVYIHEIKFGADGLLYAAAEKCILKIDPENGEYSNLIEGDFSGNWGAYGISLDNSGNIYVGDHAGGIQLFLKDQNWKKHTIIGRDKNNPKSESFGGIALKENTIFYLDFENSLLKTASCQWSANIPEVLKINELHTGLNYPEFLQLWNGDIFVKAARGENILQRIRSNKVVEKYHLECNEDMAPIVTFHLEALDDKNALFYGASWSGTLYRGKLTR